ncbi:hypothetical protein [Paraburkholderia sp. CNPSo 3281]|uniref:hypothetical protein n=1 Tax=Paraburkholderia sp. CNPSo 3281 TaxID=2940933 RepID=UPI0035CD1ECD
MKDVVEVLQQFIRSDEGWDLDVGSAAFAFLANIKDRPYLGFACDGNSPAKDIEAIFLGHGEIYLQKQLRSAGSPRPANGTFRAIRQHTAQASPAGSSRQRGRV